MRQDAEGYAGNCEALAAAQPADIGRIACPTLLVTGEEDGVAPPSNVRAMARAHQGGAGSRACPAAGTGRPWSAAAEVQSALKEFLSARH